MTTFRIVEEAGDYVNCLVVLDNGAVVVLPVYGEERKTLAGIEEQLDRKIATLTAVADVAPEVRDAIHNKTVMVIQAKARKDQIASMDEDATR